MKIHWVIAGIVVIGIGALAVLAATVLWWGIYVQRWEGPMVYRIASTVSLPAARFAGTSILLRDYLNDVESLKTYLASEEAVQAKLTREITDDDRKQALERLLQEAATKELADIRKIAITDEQVQEAIQTEFVSSGGDQAAFEVYLQKNFRWTLQDFEKHVVRPVLLERLLTASYAADHENDLEAFQTYLDDRLKKDDVVRYVKF